jgi:hypothetical protein
MATIVSTISGNNITYTITDVAGNTGTVISAKPSGTLGTLTANISTLLPDGLRLFNVLLNMLTTGLRPVTLPGTNASFGNI